MKTALFLLVLVVSASGTLALPSTDAPTVITREDLKKTLEHIVQLSKEQKAENEKLQGNLNAALESAGSGIAHGVELQKQVDAVTADRNAQAKAKDEAEAERDALKIELAKKDAVIKARENKIAKLKTMLCAEAAISALFLLLWLRIPSFGPWGIGITIGGPMLIFGIAWRFL